MDNMKLMFLILRKNTKLLKEFICGINNPQIRSGRRKHIIFLKEQLAGLPFKKYNLIKTIATDVNRFEIITPARDFKDEFVYLIVPGTDIVLNTFSQFSYAMESVYGNNEKDPDPQVLYDKKLNMHFILDRSTTTVKNITLFSDTDHVWFTRVFNAIKDAKDAEEEIIKQRELMEAERKIELVKEGILDLYS